MLHSEFTALLKTGDVSLLEPALRGLPSGQLIAWDKETGLLASFLEETFDVKEASSRRGHLDVTEALLSAGVSATQPSRTSRLRPIEALFPECSGKEWTDPIEVAQWVRVTRALVSKGAVLNVPPSGRMGDWGLRSPLVRMLSAGPCLSRVAAALVEEGLLSTFLVASPKDTLGSWPSDLTWSVLQMWDPFTAGKAWRHAIKEGYRMSSFRWATGQTLLHVMPDKEVGCEGLLALLESGADPRVLNDNKEPLLEYWLKDPVGKLDAVLALLQHDVTLVEMESTRLVPVYADVLAFLRSETEWNPSAELALAIDRIRAFRRQQTLERTLDLGPSDDLASPCRL